MEFNGTVYEDDKKLIENLREQLKDELVLMPEYDDDRSLLRWLVGWNRNVGTLCLRV